MYSMVTVVNNTVFASLRVKKVDLESSHYKKKNCNHKL